MPGASGSCCCSRASRSRSGPWSSSAFCAAPPARTTTARIRCQRLTPRRVALAEFLPLSSRRALAAGCTLVIRIERIRTAPITTIVASPLTPVSARPFLSSWIRITPSTVPSDAAGAAEDAGAAEHHRGDHVELEAGAHVGARGADPRDEDVAGEPRHQAGEGVDRELVAVDRDAGEARRELVVADRVERAAEGRVRQHDRREQDRDQQEPELGRHAQDLALAEAEEPLRIAAHRARLADALGQAAVTARASRAS